MYNSNYDEKCERKVVIYARVSTEHEAQLSALENQKDWYKPILENHPEWKVVRMYVDEGITGTSAKKRPQFMKMIDDADKKEFDLILTREVSRFARNTVDTLQYTRQLKAKGVEVFFINDNIKTFDGDGELRLTIMATLAQDESRKTSVRVKAGQQTSMDNGVFYGNGNILGYDRVGKDMVINPEQAETVKMIFDMYLHGVGVRAMQFKLEQEGRLTATGKKKWYVSNIARILKNTFYCGIITYHKQWTPDYLEQKKINNIGDMEFTQVEGTHEPIISKEDFFKVQEIIKSKQRKNPESGAGQKRVFGQRVPIDVWTELLECNCGRRFNRHKWHYNKETGEKKYAYQCYSSVRSGTINTRLKKGLSIENVCDSPMIPEWKLQMMAKYIIRNFVNNKQEMLDFVQSLAEKHIDDEPPKTDYLVEIEKKENEKAKYVKKLNSLIELRLDGDIDKEMFQTKKNEIQQHIDSIEAEIKKLQPQEEIQEEEFDHEQKINILRSFMEDCLEINDDGKDLSPRIIRAFVRKIVVYKDYIEWHLRFRDPDDPNSIEKMTIEGTRKKNAKVSPLCSLQHRLQLAKVGNNKKIAELLENSQFTEVYEFTITYEEAKEFLYSYSTRHRVYYWKDLKVKVLV